jgi:hypothetical protein
VCVRSSRTELPSRGRPHSEKTGEMAKTCGAFPQPGNAPHKFHFRHFRSVPRLLNRAPRQRAMLTKDRVLLAPPHRASPRSSISAWRGRRLYPPSAGCQKSGGQPAAGPAIPPAELLRFHITRETTAQGLFSRRQPELRPATDGAPKETPPTSPQFQQAVDGLWAAAIQRPRTRLNLARSVRSRLAST